jgi:hypothetical protein
MDYGLAFRELMWGDTNFSRFMMLKYHNYLQSSCCLEQLDFIIAVYQYRKLFEREKLTRKDPIFISTNGSSVALGSSVHSMSSSVELDNKQRKKKEKREIIQDAFWNICHLYIASNAMKQINISSQVREEIMQKASMIKKKKNVHLKVNDNDKKEEKEKESEQPIQIIYGEEIKKKQEKKIVGKKVFNQAFLETLKLCLTNLRLFLQKVHKHPEWKHGRSHKTGNVYKLSEHFDVVWCDDDDDGDKEELFPSTELTNSASGSSSFGHRNIRGISKSQDRSRRYVESPDGRLKSLEEEITDILR